MSFSIDATYLNQIGHRLPMFKKKGKDLWNCRCILCGDSTTNTRKARGYFYRTKNDLYYKCHNCSESMHFGTFLKRLDSILYQKYVFERYSSGENGPKAHTNAEVNLKFEEPTFVKKIDLRSVATPLDELHIAHEVVRYCLDRKIPLEKHSSLWAIRHVSDISKLSDKYERLKSTEPRLLLPMYNDQGDLSGVSMRGVRGEHLRYITARFSDDDEPLIFGLKEVDETKPIYVTEGPIDSLFLNNAIAVCGTSFSKLESLAFPKEKLTVIFDNQPRNVEVCKLLEKYINLGYLVCIWPSSIVEKDINDMVLNNIDVNRVIAENTYYGLMANLKFKEWKRC
jgi:hypothetical protein